MKNVKWLFVGMLLLVVSFVLAGCGGGGGGSSSPAPTYSISGTVTGFSAQGVTITLSSGATTTTGANGSYIFSGLANGTYTVAASKPGSAFTPMNQSVTVSGSNITGVDFAAVSAAATYSISGTVSGPTQQGVVMTLSGSNSGSTTTASDGTYIFSGLVNGTYTITPSKAGSTFTPSNRSVTVSSANVPSQDFTITVIPTAFAISGTVSGAVTQGVTITLSGAGTASTTTGVGGTYSFANMPNGTYIITPSLTGYTFSPTNKSVTVSGADVAGQNFTATAVNYSISGTVSGAVAQGVTITLSGAAGTTTTTDSSGNYTITGLTNGTYTVTPSLSGYTFSPASTSVTISNGNQTGKNFLATAVIGSTYSISGSVSIQGGGALPGGATITLSGAANGTTTTDATGAYTFNNLAAGTYTVTPSFTGWTFSPASSSQTITNANITNVNFTATSVVTSYSISGTVNYSGSKTGTIHVNLMYAGGGVFGIGTSIASPGSFTIRGVQPGSYQIYAWRDTLNNGVQNIVNPSGTSAATYNVTNANITGASVTMTDPASLPAPSTPSGVSVSPLSGGGGAIITWNLMPNPNGNGDGASAYKIYWSTDSGFTVASSVSVPETDNGVYFQSGLTNGQVLYYRMTSLINAAESSPSTVFGPVTIGAPPPVNDVTVSGQVTFSGSAIGHRLWVAIVDQSKSTGNLYGTSVMSPASPLSFTIHGVQPGTYFLVAFVDMDDNGRFSLGDKMPDFDAMPTFTVASSSITGKNITLPNSNSAPAVHTIHDLSGGNHSYDVNFRIKDILKRADKATVVSGPNVPLPLDLGRVWNNIEDSVWLGSTTPTVGDTYAIDVTYSDGTTETVTVSVTGLVGTSNLATPVSPTGVTSSLTPTFTWSAPSSPPVGGYTYDVGIQPQNGGNWIWSYPNNGPSGMPSTQLSVLYNADGSANQATLTSGANYDWWIDVKDSNGNVGANHATFSISGGVTTYSISGTLTNNTAYQTSTIMIGVCTDIAYAICNYGTSLSPGAGGPYTISNVPAGTYYLGACVDANNNGTCDLASDPTATYTANPITISSSNITGINVTIP